MTRFILEEALGYVAERTVRVLRKELRKRFRMHGYDISPYQFILLYRLWEEQGLPQSEIARRTIMDEPTLSRMIDVLEKQGFLYRERSRNDRRRIRLFLTDRGRSLQAVLPPIVAEHLEQATRGIDPQAVVQLRKTLAQIDANFGEPVADERPIARRTRTTEREETDEGSS